MVCHGRSGWLQLPDRAAVADDGPSTDLSGRDRPLGTLPIIATGLTQACAFGYRSGLAGSDAGVSILLAISSILLRGSSLRLIVRMRSSPWTRYPPTCSPSTCAMATSRAARVPDAQHACASRPGLTMGLLAGAQTAAQLLVPLPADRRNQRVIGLLEAPIRTLGDQHTSRHSV